MSKMGNYALEAEESAHEMDLKPFLDEYGADAIDIWERINGPSAIGYTPIKTFKVDVKWTGTIASFQVEAINAEHAQELANKKLDMESNGLIHFDTKEV
tara:strand:+ start:470 stop:766 length:297 start_codon:yes stop_codon:yes gene_type:complete